MMDYHFVTRAHCVMCYERARSGVISTRAGFRRYAGYAVASSGIRQDGILSGRQYIFIARPHSSSNMATDSSTDKMDLDSGQGQGEGTPEQEAHEPYEPTEPGGSGDETVEITDTSGRRVETGETPRDTNTGEQPGVGELVCEEAVTVPMDKR